MKIQIRDGSTIHKCQYEAKSPSGFSIVIPSWKIKELLLQEELMTPIIEDEKEATKKAESKTVAEAHSAKDSDAAFTKEVFESMLKQASQKISPPDQEKKETSE